MARMTVALLFLFLVIPFPVSAGPPGDGRAPEAGSCDAVLVVVPDGPAPWVRHVQGIVLRARVGVPLVLAFEDGPDGHPGGLSPGEARRELQEMEAVRPAELRIRDAAHLRGPDAVARLAEEARAACLRLATEGPRHLGFQDEVVVVGRRVETTIAELPSTVDVVDEEDVEATQATTAGDLLKETPGISLADTGIAGQQRVFIRGLGNQRVLVLIDGERVTSQRDRRGAPLLVEPDDIERVEVLKGSGSVIYGSDAIGGVVNIVTRSGRGEQVPLGGEAGLRFSGANDLVQWTAALAGKVGRVDYRVSWADTDAGERETPRGTLPNTRYESSELAVRFGVTLSPADRLEMRAERYRSDDLGIYTGDPDFRFTLPWWNRDRVSLRLEHSAPTVPVKVARFRISHATIDKALASTIRVPLGPMGTMVLGTRSESETTEDGFAGQFVLAVGGWEMTTGAELRTDAARGPATRTTNFPFPSTEKYVPVDARQTTFGVFADLVRPWSRGDLDVGLRWEQVRTKNNAFGEYRVPGEITDGAFTGALGATWNLRGGWSLYGHVSSGFRVPSLLELYYESPAWSEAGIAYGNPDLDPERSREVEVGFRGRRRHWVWQGSAYGTWLRDMIEFRRVPSRVVPGGWDYVYDNVGRARIVGLEGRLEGHFAPHCTGVLTASWSRGVDRVEGDPVFVPPLSVVANLRWDGHLAGGRWPAWVQVDLRWMDGQDRVPHVWNPDGTRDRAEEARHVSHEFATVDLAVGVRTPLAGRVVAVWTVRGNNLLDRWYEEPFSAVPQPGRHLVASARFVF